MQTLGYVLMARILFASLVLDQISSQAVERRLETLDLTQASQSLTKTSIETKLLSGPQLGNGSAVMLGARFCRYLTPNLYLGGGGYGGRLLGSVEGAESIGFGGIVGGAELPLTDTLSLEASTLIGASGAKYVTQNGPTTGSSLVIEPQVSFIFRLAKGIRGGVQGSYVSFSSMHDLDGYTVGLFIDLRKFTLSFSD